MDAAHALIADAATKLVSELPAPYVEALAADLQAGTGSKPQIVQVIPHLHYRGLAGAFIDLWQNRAGGGSPEAVAMALRTACHAEQLHRAGPTGELAWAGASTNAHPLRRTEQAVLQVLDSARQRITLVSYAVYRIPNICEALVGAASRGVQINVILETPNKLEGQNEYDTLRAMGSEVASCSAVYYWPQEN